MDNEQLTVREFLTAHHPFDQLPEEVLTLLSEELEPHRLAPGERVLEFGKPNAHCYIVHSGAIEVHDPEGQLLARLGEGDVFGQRSLLSDGIADNCMQAGEATVLYRLPAAAFHRLYRDYAAFRYFFGRAGQLRDTLYGQEADDRGSVNLMTTTVAEILRRSPVTLPTTATLREAAQTMTQEGISSLLLVQDGTLAGIVTDRDLRSRVLAAGLNYDRPVSEIMTPSPAAIDARSYAYEALLAMARHGFNHLPVLCDGELKGMITATDLLQRYSTSPLYLISDIYKQQTVEGLVQVSRRLAQMLVILVEANASAQSIGHVVSSIGEAITSRLLTLAEAQLGPPPVPYAWLTGGSMGRREQTAHSDQDNCLLLADGYRKDTHDAYFEPLSRFVCDGLNACGYIYCPGEIMAITPRWRQPLQIWKDYFDGWIDQPDPKALLNATIFFDLRCLHGEQGLFKELWAYVLDKARRNQLFHAHMAVNALSHQPPLGFFRNFVLIKDGKHDQTLDLKHTGVVPIIDIARVYALAGGIEVVNTRDRLEAAQRQGGLSQDGAADLMDALEYIGITRLRHQARLIRRGKPPDNYMPLDELSHFERNRLKDAFLVVKTMQSTFAQRYQRGFG